jgi:hypothetical protein
LIVSRMARVAGSTSVMLLPVTLAVKTAGTIWAAVDGVALAAADGVVAALVAAGEAAPVAAGVAAAALVAAGEAAPVAAVLGDAAAALVAPAAGDVAAAGVVAPPAAGLPAGGAVPPAQAVERTRAAPTTALKPRSLHLGRLWCIGLGSSLFPVYHYVGRSFDGFELSRAASIARGSTRTEGKVPRVPA